MLSNKGKHAGATEKRRFVWNKIVWPLILDIQTVSFSLKQYQNKRDQVCQEKNVQIIVTSRGFASLLQKEMLMKEKNIYSIHYKLIPYMRLNAQCNYATAINEVKM